MNTPYQSLSTEQQAALATTYEQRRAQELQEAADKREKLEALARDVEGYLSLDWKLQVTKEEMGEGQRLRFVNDSGMAFNFSGGGYGYIGKIHVSTYTYPTYTYRDSRGELKSETVAPQHMYENNVKQSSPSITVSDSKSAQQIAKDIQRRFLPEYTRVYELCKVQAASNQRFHDLARDSWSTVCSVLGEDGKRNSYAPRMGNGIRMEVENRSSSVRVVMDLSAEQLEVVVKALGGVEGVSK